MLFRLVSSGGVPMGLEGLVMNKSLFGLAPFLTLLLLIAPINSAYAQQLVGLNVTSDQPLIEMPKWASQTCEGHVEHVVDHPAIGFYPLAWDGDADKSGVLIYHVSGTEVQALYLAHVGNPDKASCKQRPGTYNTVTGEFTFEFGSGTKRKIVLSTRDGTAVFTKGDFTLNATRAGESAG